MPYGEICLWLAEQGAHKQKQYQDQVITDTKLPMYGIAMGALRKKAKALSLEDWPLFFREAKHESFEEVLLLGLTLAYAKLPFAKKIPYIRRLLPHLDSWAHTDSIVPTFRIPREDLLDAWEFTLECLDSREEYTVRFGVIMLMDYFCGPETLAQTLTLLVNLQDPRYYVQMAVAWCLAEIAVDHYQAVESILQAGVLDKFTHNKTIQKMRESYRISPQQKERAKALKRKETENAQNYGN